jgi:xanthine dehydrogenase accessory factor
MPRPDLVERADRLRRDRVPFVLATVVRAERPTSAKPGDAALVLADGTMEGFVGGTCAESTVRLQSMQVLESGESTLLLITGDEGAGRGERPTDRPGQVTVANPCLSGGTLEIFLEPAVPPVLVLVQGGAPIARAVVAAGQALGFDARLVAPDDPTELPPDATAVVVASHGRGEEAMLARALEAGIPYVGLVASPRRGSEVVAALPTGDDLRGRVRTPAGLDIGARTPAEVALSILAEIVAVRPRPGSASARPRANDPTTGPRATDPVCGMSVATVDASLHLDHHGTRHWFCGPGCRDAFADEPDRYVLA